MFRVVVHKKQEFTESLFKFAELVEIIKTDLILKGSKFKKSA